VRFQPRSKIVAEDDAYIYPPKGIGLHQHRTDAERSSDVAGPGRVTATSHYQGGINQRIGIPQEHHVEFLPSEHSGGRASGSLTPGAVQHFDRDATCRGELEMSGCSFRFRFRPQQEGPHYEKEYHDRG
jgi:hypothetical protein